MNNFKQRLLNNWSLMRILRAGIGLWLLGVGIYSRDWTIGLFSGFFLYQAITDTGCCGSQACYTPGKKTVGKNGHIPEIEYEEVE